MTETVTMEATAPVGAVFAVDQEKRTIRGLAVPYGVEGTKGGKRYSFSKGTVRTDEPSRVKLWIGHDKATAVGVAFELNDTDAGLAAAFKVARGPEGDRALTMAEDGVWDGLSLGPSEGAKFQLRDGVYHSVDVPLNEISLTPAPVFGGARVSSVAFDAEEEKGGMTATDTEVEVAVEPQTFDVTPIVTPIANAIRDGFAGLQTPQENGPERVSATEGLTVDEPSPYRFDGNPGEHSFTDDLRDMKQDFEAKARIDSFLEELQTFAVTSTNVAGLNPSKQRPDLFVPNLQYTRPLWELVSTGTITDKTPFIIPKFSSASGLVGDHTEGTEPTPGAFAATTQTVTPTAMSGKIEIDREVIDQGGSPKADGIIWGEMLNGWYEAIEAKIAATLAGTGTAELNLAGAVDKALITALTNYFAGLQYVRGGNRFTAFAADGSLFPKLVSAADDNGRPLLPVLGPQNAEGQTSGGFDRVQLGGQTIRAAWALGTGNDKLSYSFVPSSVWAWASAPRRFDFEYQVKSVDMAIWGYVAGARLRDADIKPVDYTTADS
jgi:HK97 family phage prohead protease